MNNEINIIWIFANKHLQILNIYFMEVYIYVCVFVAIVVYKRVKKTKK